MRTALRRLLTDIRHRYICATGKRRPARHLDTSARACNRSWDAWIEDGMPYRRALWLSAWIVHYALWPIRSRYGV